MTHDRFESGDNRYCWPRSREVLSYPDYNGPLRSKCPSGQCFGYCGKRTFNSGRATVSTTSLRDYRSGGFGSSCPMLTSCEHRPLRSLSRHPSLRVLRMHTQYLFRGHYDGWCRKSRWKSGSGCAFRVPVRRASQVTILERRHAQAGVQLGASYGHGADAKLSQWTHCYSAGPERSSVALIIRSSYW